ncbi:TPA: hypothetical protein TZW69_002107 [Streptococcus suis]|uniref:hypothetical protein n=1 Tax=Streptococcus suis TaxID=1307 RepID=UPI002A7D4165|nr:hypothetical protein [Streptococcus suis]HEL2438170.1 hypothetical protein [Streptococcus suis]HEP1792785.1 hypothetical protein [Streptococcus suis]HEP1797362.1 hypothetical protein [Streptococcus suis]
MAYIVTRNILDSKDNNRLYETGETYPRPDFTVSDNRIKELLGKGVIESDGAEGDLTPDTKTEGDLSAKELKAKLDELGIKYGSRASKDELKALLEGAEGE